jgi:hypothetical protein
MYLACSIACSIALVTFTKLIWIMPHWFNNGPHQGSLDLYKLIKEIWGAFNPQLS